VSRIGKEKPSPISSYVFHLYNKNECLKGTEIDELRIARNLLDFRIESHAVTPEDLLEPKESYEKAARKV